MLHALGGPADFGGLQLFSCKRLLISPKVMHAHFHESRPMNQQCWQVETGLFCLAFFDFDAQQQALQLCILLLGTAFVQATLSFPLSHLAPCKRGRSVIDSPIFFSVFSTAPVLTRA